jgi:hypothetical protein
MRTKRALILLIAGLSLVYFTTLFTSCTNYDDDVAKTAFFKVILTDAPGNYEEVNIEVKEIAINTGTEQSEWKILTLKETKTYNLLELTGGTSALLSEFHLEEGRLEQIRLILGEEVTIKVDGQLHRLKVPSGSKSGLKINVHADVEAGIEYKLILDFDVAKSIIEKGNGAYGLKPTIRASIESESGAITGLISPKEIKAIAFAIQGSDTIASAYSDTDGQFLLRALPVGSYSVNINPLDDTKNEVNLSDVLVSLGKVKNIGTITFTDK